MKQTENDRKEYEFRLFPTNKKSYVRTHYCDSDEIAVAELRGMMYAMFFEYKRPKAELWYCGKLICSIS